MIRRREELRANIKSRRRGKSFASDLDHSAAGSSVGRIAVGEDITKEADPCCNRSNVYSSSPLNVTASTTSMSINYFDTSFNSGETEINTPVDSPGGVGCSTPIVNKMIRIGNSFDVGDRSSLTKKMLTENQTHLSSVVSPTKMQGWTSSLSPKTGLTPEKKDLDSEKEWDPLSDHTDNDWNPFGGNADGELAALECSAIKISFDDDEVGAVESPVCVNEMNSFTRKQLDEPKTSLSSLEKENSSVKEEMLHSFREENERLRNEIREASEEAGTLHAAEALVDESYRGSIADERTLEEVTLESSTFYEDTVGVGIVDEGTQTTYCYSIDEGTSYNSRSRGDLDDVTSESDLESGTLGSVSASSSRNSSYIRNVNRAGPSSRTLRQALRRQSKSCAATSTFFDEMTGTYEDACNAFNQVLNAFFVSLDDVDKVSDAIGGVKKELCMSHTDKFVPRSKLA